MFVFTTHNLTISALHFTQKNTQTKNLVLGNCVNFFSRGTRSGKKFEKVETLGLLFRFFTKVIKVTQFDAIFKICKDTTLLGLDLGLSLGSY